MEPPINYAQALSIVRNFLKEEQEKYDACEVEVVEKCTVVRAFGWIFYFQSADFLRTGEFKHLLGGNGPIVVRKDTGELFTHHPGQRVEEVAAYHMRKGVKITVKNWERDWLRQNRKNLKRSEWRSRLEAKNREAAAQAK